MASKKIRLVVELTLPEGATQTRARAYVEEAVQCWAGSLQPPGADLGDGTVAQGDPMFNLDKDTVKVSRPRF